MTLLLRPHRLSAGQEGPDRRDILAHQTVGARQDLVPLRLWQLVQRRLQDLPLGPADRMVLAQNLGRRPHKRVGETRIRIRGHRAPFPAEPRPA